MSPPNERISMLQIDSFIEIGETHKICEDYIVTGYVPVPFIIVSDGCSSANDTEMGARILGHLAKQYIQYHQDDLHDLDYYRMGNWIIINAELTARQLGLNASCLTATLIISYVLDGQVYVYMYGDGCVVLKKNNDNIDIESIEFTNNAPYYLAYLIDQNKHQIYHDNKNSMTMISTQNGVERIYKDFAYDYRLKMVFKLSDYKTILICTDGIDSFFKKEGMQQYLFKSLYILPSFIEFKNTKGAFLQRRMKKAIKALENDNTFHGDDLTIGAYLRTE